MDVEDKGEIAVLEHKLVEHEDPNSPEAILDRYPLLRVMSEAEREALNRRVRRRIDIRMLPTLTVCLMINYLDRYVTFASISEIAHLQIERHQRSCRRYAKRYEHDRRRMGKSTQATVFLVLI
jgi:hypothetical protein